MEYLRLKKKKKKKTLKSLKNVKPKLLILGLQNVGDFRNITEIMDHFLDILEMYQKCSQFCNPN